jgi:ankyrin repeat protein
MKHSLLGLSLFAALLFGAPRLGAEEKVTAGLSAAIVTEKDKSGTPTIDRRGKFQVVFTNRSKKPILLWSEKCHFGHGTLSFRVEDGDGVASLMRKRIVDPSGLEYAGLGYERPKTITILPGQSYAWDVALDGFFWGTWEWKGGPEPNTGRLVTLTAVLSIKLTDSARQQGVWTGRLTSQPMRALVVDPKLRTPHEYLWADCPKQALKLMKADRTWIKKTDDSQCTPLHHAARFRHVEVARWLLDNRADVNARAYNDFTPLHFAWDVRMIKLLLQYKPDLNAKLGRETELEKFASRYAQIERHPDCAAERKEILDDIKLLRDAGAEYDIRSACYLGDVEQVRALLVADKKKALDTEAMRWAATYGRTRIVKLLLEHGADPEDAHYGGLTVSYFAIEHPAVLKLLFDAGANPKVRVEYRGNGNGPQGSSLLHEAAARGKLESVKLLLSKGIDVNRSFSSGRTALHAACGGGHIQLVEWLLQNKANARARTKAGWTPMASAVAQVRPEHEEDNIRYQAVIRALARTGAEMDVFAAIACNDLERIAKILQKQPKAGEARDPTGRPALHCAVTLDRREIVKRLLDGGADPDIRSRDKSSGHKDETALLDAAFWGRPEIAEMLIKRGAKVNAKADRGVVPLHEAARMGHLDMARLLLKHRADVNAKDNEGKTPLDWVGSDRDSSQMIKVLRDHGGKK